MFSHTETKQVFENAKSLGRRKRLSTLFSNENAQQHELETIMVFRFGNRDRGLNTLDGIGSQHSLSVHFFVSFLEKEANPNLGELVKVLHADILDSFLVCVRVCQIVGAPGMTLAKFSMNVAQIRRKDVSLF